MNQKPPVASSASLIERAAEVYGLREALRNPGPVVSTRTPTPIAPPAAQTVAQPAAAPIVQPVAATPAPVAMPQPAAVQPAAELAPAPPQAAVAEVASPLHQEMEPVAQPAMAEVAQELVEPTQAVPKAAVQRRSASVDLEALSDAGFIVPGAPPSPLSEEFRLVKRQLLLQAFGGRNSAPLEKGRLILMCSAQPNEGKTFSSVNLALSMAAETDIEVLLVDADVAKPEILSTLGLPGGPGFMDALADPTIDVESLVINTNIPGLSVLPAGRQYNTDTELLASDKTQQLIDKLIERNPRRIILFDSAPALAASPASVLALHVGQILLVVRADQTSESELREALALLEGDARVQMVLNRVTYSSSNRKFGYYYGFGEKS